MDSTTSPNWQILIDSFLQKGSSVTLEDFVKLDELGLLVSSKENESEYIQRICEFRKQLASFEKQLTEQDRVVLDVDITATKEEIIPSKYYQEIESITQTQYGFKIFWVPGFFISKSLSILWAGCTLVSDDKPFPVFIIRAAFAHKKRWLIYQRTELLAHEICHVARAPLDDLRLEEHFAYAISNSKLRQWMGNCFQTNLDAILFAGPLLFLCLFQGVAAITQLPIPQFVWFILMGIANLFPLFLIGRNFIYRFRVKKAQKLLSSIGIHMPNAVLFRMLTSEIFVLAKLKNNSISIQQQLLQFQAQDHLRWEIIIHRFIPHLKKED